jgi:hypothetical protein
MMISGAVRRIDQSLASDAWIAQDGEHVAVAQQLRAHLEINDLAILLHQWPDLGTYVPLGNRRELGFQAWHVTLDDHIGDGLANQLTVLIAEQTMAALVHVDIHTLGRGDEHAVDRFLENQPGVAVNVNAHRSFSSPDFHGATKWRC